MYPVTDYTFLPVPPGVSLVSVQSTYSAGHIPCTRMWRTVPLQSSVAPLFDYTNRGPAVTAPLATH